MISDELAQKAAPSDPVAHPSHYELPPCPDCGTPYETRWLIEDMPFFRGAAIKYAIRAGRKHSDTELEDIRKAIQCLQFEAERITRKDTTK